jgi:hypothetical protein
MNTNNKTIKPKFKSRFEITSIIGIHLLLTYFSNWEKKTKSGNII